MDGVEALLYLFLGVLCAVVAVGYLEKGKIGWMAFYTAASFFNILTYFHAIKS